MFIGDQQSDSVGSGLSESELFEYQTHPKIFKCPEVWSISNINFTRGYPIWDYPKIWRILFPEWYFPFIAGYPNMYVKPILLILIFYEKVSCVYVREMSTFHEIF